MLEIVGNLWDFYDSGEYVCITTNGVVPILDDRFTVVEWNS